MSATQARRPAGTPTGGQWAAGDRAAATITLTETVPELAGAAVPTVSFDTLWHVGSLDAADKQASSYEGQGLSVSVDPDDWAAIARLGGDTWQLERPGNAFCDYHALTEAQKDAITAWGVQNGYVERREVYAVTWHDDEFGSDFTTHFTDAGEAEAEAEWRNDEAEDGDAVVRAVPVVQLSATDAFPDPTVAPGDIDPHEVLATVWVAQHTDLDGVWWQHEYAPERLSAPRGVIRPEKVTAWQRSPAQ